MNAGRAYYMGKRMQIVKAGIVARVYALVHRQQESQLIQQFVPIIAPPRFVARFAD
jgi:hypothetical protein